MAETSFLACSMTSTPFVAGSFQIQLLSQKARSEERQVISGTFGGWKTCAPMTWLSSGHQRRKIQVEANESVPLTSVQITRRTIGFFSLTLWANNSSFYALNFLTFLRLLTLSPLRPDLCLIFFFMLLYLNGSTQIFLCCSWTLKKILEHRKQSKTSLFWWNQSFCKFIKQYCL